MRRLPTWWNQPSFKEFKKLYSEYKEHALFFLGSGISIQAGLPNWRGLLEKILEQSNAYLKEPISLEELDQLYRELKQKETGISEAEYPPLEKATDIFDIDKRFYPEIASFLKAKIDAGGGQAQWRRILDSILNPEAERSGSTIHEAIVTLPWHAIVTTNYDTLIEGAYERKFGPQSRPLFVARPGDIGLDKHGQEKFVYKIHGDISDPDSIIVLTKEEYDEIYGRSEKNNTPTSTMLNLQGVLRGADVTLFAGYSHDDVTLREFYSQATQHTRKDAFALVPLEGSITERKISKLSAELDIRFIGYSTDDNHRELLEFFEYLAAPGSKEAEIRSHLYTKRPTVVMLYCGGTIGSAKAEDETTKDNTPLKVTKISTRFDPRLSEFSGRLLKWYQDTYNLGSSVDLEVMWEVLPEQHQVFSENATPELWNVVLDKVDNVVFKYFQAPQIIGDNPFLKSRDDKNLTPDDEKLFALYDEEDKEFKKFQAELNVPPKQLQGLSSSEFISDFQSRYILGILLLTGTDTMGYLVAALSFGFQHMPCSMIVTGSNLPPDESIPGMDPDLNKSDSPKNILAAFYFLQSFGHTLTDSFICFGDTIHHGVNVRKIASELGPINSNPSKEVEPFVFRNLHIRGQYMFRLIDGVFCNNYYPSWIPYLKLVGPHGENFDLRHIRRDPLQRRPGKNNALHKSDFCNNSAICHIVASPSLPLINVKEMCTPGEGRSPLRLVIIEGYASGTYPTQRCSNMEQLLYDLYQHSIPIYLISQYGLSEKQQSYEVELVRGLNIPVTPMANLTIETALPILALVINNIEEQEDWGTCNHALGDADGNEERGKLLERRRRLIDQYLHKFYTARPNILTNEIVPDKITKRVKWDETINVKEKQARAETIRKAKIQDRGNVSPELFLKAFNTKIGRKLKEKYVHLYKHDFSLLISEVARRDESKGASPDGFAALSDLGFEYGQALVQAVEDTLLLKSGRGFVKLFYRDFEEQKELLGMAVEIVQKVAKLLRTANIANVTVLHTSFPKAMIVEPGQWIPKQSFSFDIRSRRFETLTDVDEKFTAVSFSEDDARFFEKLSSGWKQEEGDLEKYYRDVEISYEMVLRSKWTNITTSLDWLLVGIFKGVTCGIAEFLRFDNVAVEAALNKEKVGQSVFRKAAHCFVLDGDKRDFDIRLSYHESTSLLGPAKD
ncbi:MAG TPA: SIR2 family protein [Pyrinomonadaceae bacterium]|jgi:hypothetical protein